MLDRVVDVLMMVGRIAVVICAIVGIFGPAAAMLLDLGCMFASGGQCTNIAWGAEHGWRIGVALASMMAVSVVIISGLS